MGEEDQTQQFWREFMKTDEAQDALKAQYKEEYEQLADKYEKKVKPDELRELGEALLDVSRDLKHVVAPVLKYEFAQRLLYGLLQECQSKKVDFSEQLERHHIRFLLEQFGEEVRVNPAKGPQINESWWRVMCDKLQEENKKDSFGVVRYVDVHECCELMNQGGSCLEMGTKKFSEKNWELALDRYTMGVDMLQNARSRSPDNDDLITETTSRLLKNQAACALKLELWGLAARACDKCLHLRPSDPKALYRKGVAELQRGNLEVSAAAFGAVVKLKPPTMDDAFEYSEARRAAEKQLRGIRRRKKDSNQFAKNMVAKGIHLFSNDRDSKETSKEMDEGLKRHVAAKLGQADEMDRREEPRLSLGQAVRLQAKIAEIYATLAFKTELAELKKQDDFLSKGLRGLVERRRYPLLSKHGFTPDARGQRALDRAIARHFGDSRVRTKAAELFAMLTEGVKLS